MPVNAKCWWVTTAPDRSLDGQEKGCYISTMADDQTKVQVKEQEAIWLQEIESNPFDDEDIALFDLFDHRGWSPEQRRAYIIAQAKGALLPDAAE